MNTLPFSHSYNRKRHWTNIFRKAGRSVWVADKFAFELFTKESSGNVLILFHLFGYYVVYVDNFVTVFVAYDLSRRRKTHSTCSSHVSPALLFYIPGWFFGCLYESTLSYSLHLVWILNDFSLCMILGFQGFFNRVIDMGNLW